MTTLHVSRGDLRLPLEVTVRRVGRKRCPSCRLLRQLVAITVFAVDQPVGYGEALCLDCAGLRLRPADYAGYDPQP